VSKKAINVISLFSGAGGMDIGFINAGCKIVWANDFNADAVQTYKKNIGEHIVLGDISAIDTKEIAKNTKNIDIVIGGFPCQGFSIANKNRGMEDSRNFLYLEMLRVIKDKSPKFFVVENVKGLLSINNGKTITMIVKDFENIGYKVDYKLLNSADYGVPQYRERVIIIGNKIGVKNIFPEKMYTNLYENEDKNTQLSIYQKSFKPHKTVKESIEFLENVEIVNGKVEQNITINGINIYNHIASTSVKDKFFGRKYKVNQADICDYLKYWRQKSGWSTKRVDEYFGYKYTAGHWFRKDNKSGSIPNPKDWFLLKKY
jgi:DNA (cytosine-5)-methyltransferase 1